MNDNYQYTPLYYATPCQIRYYEAECGQYLGGIAYHDFVICGRRGVVLTIDRIVEGAVKSGICWDNAIIELEWINLSDEIKGE